MLTTIVDHNDIRIRSIEPDGGKPYFQVNDSWKQNSLSAGAAGRSAHGPSSVSVPLT